MTSTRSPLRPRRLVPNAPRPLYVTEQGACVTKDKERVVVRREKEILASVRMLDFSQVCVSTRR